MLVAFKDGTITDYKCTTGIRKLYVNSIAKPAGEFPYIGVWFTLSEIITVCRAYVTIDNKSPAEKNCRIEGRLGFMTEEKWRDNIRRTVREKNKHTMTADRVVNSYEAGLVQRYHTHPRFARFGQTDGQHQWSVAMLIITLHPNPSTDLIKEAIGHDTGERFSGDIPSPVKRLDPEMGAKFDAAEIVVRNEKTLPVNDLTPDEQAWLKMCDVAECYMFAAHTVPEGLDTKNWITLRDSVITMSKALKVKPVVSMETLLDTVKNRAGFVEEYG